MDVLFDEKREELARIIHESFLEDLKASKEQRPPDDPAKQPWDALGEGYKESNRQQADNIPRFLHAIGYGFTPVVGREPVKTPLSADDIEKIAHMDDERWVAEKVAQGRKHGPKKDTEIKTHSSICGWDELPKEEQDKNRQTVSRFPAYLGPGRLCDIQTGIGNIGTNKGLWVKEESYEKR